MQDLLKQYVVRVCLQLLGLLGSPGKGKNGNFERVRKGVNEICWALRAELVTPQIHLDDLEGRLHQAQVTHPFTSLET